MKLPPDSVISERKLREYLLSQGIEDDKSAFLALAGYGQDADIYQVHGTLVGPNGKALNVLTFWITLKAIEETRFVTLVPDKDKPQ